MSKKIGLCIKYYHENYGGMLQAYATISLLEKLGLDYEIIQYEKKHTFFSVIKSLPRLLNGVLLNDKYEDFLKKKGLKFHPEFSKNDSIRKKEFKKFKVAHFTKLSPIYKGYNELCEGANHYSAVITGSDQLWSPAGLPTNFYNLRFVPDNVLKISYASSFGVKKIPWYQKKRTAAFLKRIDFISMRENRGSEIVRELTGKEAPTILDPVFMFNKEEWKELVPEKREIEEPYIFAYFLGKTVEHRKAVKEAAKKFGYKIVTLRHLDQYISSDENFGDIALYDVAPDRFLNILRGAAYVCTDSFHGSCFSIINRIPFVTFNRYDEKSKHSKNSRIDTLCENLCLSNRRYNSNLCLYEQLKGEINWKLVEEKFMILKQNTEIYIDTAFGDLMGGLND